MATTLLGDLVVNLVGDDTNLLTVTRRTTAAMESAAKAVVDSSARMASAQADMASAALRAAGVFTSAMGDIETAVASATTEILGMSQAEADSVLSLRQAMLAVDEAIQARIMAEQQLDAAVMKTLTTQTDELAINNELAAASLRLQEAMLQETVATEALATAHAKSSDAVVAAAAKQQAAMKTAADVQVASARVVTEAMVEESVATEAATKKAEANAARLETVNQKIMSLGKVSAFALAGIAAYSVKAASDFQAKMLLIHTQAGDTQVDLKKLGDQVMALAPTVGIGPDKLADGLYHIESAGFRSTVALDMLAAAAKAAAIGQSDMETTTQAMIGVMAVGFKDVKSAADAQAYLNTTVGIGDMRMQQLSSAIATNVLPTFATAGLGMRDFSAAIATMTDNVTPANMAATRLRMTVALLGAPTKAAATALESVGLSGQEVTKALAHRDLLEKYGISVSKLSMDLRKPDGLLVAIMDLKDHLKAAGLDATEQAAVIERAFGGGRTSAAIQTLMQESDRLKTKYDALGTSASRQAAAQQAWAEQQQNFKQQTHELGASLQVLGIQLGEKILPPLQKFVGFLTTHQAMVITFFEVLITVLAAMAVAWIVEGIATLFALWPITLIVLGIIALIAIVALLVKYWPTVWGFIKRISLDVWHAIVDATKATMNFFKTVGVWIWQNMIYPIVAFFEWMYRMIIDAWHGIYKASMWVWDNIILPVVHFFEFLYHAILAIFNFVMAFFKKWWPLLLVVFQLPVAILIHLWNEFGSTIIRAAKVTWNAILEFFKWIWEGIRSAGVAAWHAIYDAIVQPTEEAYHWLVDKWHTIDKWLHEAWDKIVQVATAGWILFKARVIQPLEDIWNFIAGWGSRIGKSIGDAIYNALKVAINWTSKFLDVGKNMVIGIINGAISMGGTLIKKFEDLANSALKAAKSFLGISSPSKLFEDEVGKNISLGISMGIDKNAKLPQASLNTTFTGMVRTAGATLRSGPLSSVAAANSTQPETLEPIQVYVDGRKLFDILVQRSQRNKNRNTTTFLV